MNWGGKGAERGGKGREKMGKREKGNGKREKGENSAEGLGKLRQIWKNTSNMAVKT